MDVGLMAVVGEDEEDVGVVMVDVVVVVVVVVVVKVVADISDPSTLGPRISLSGEGSRWVCE
jgi:ABC-type dipeptide/oligopeptide/nickel transport system permease component